MRSALRPLFFVFALVCISSVADAKAPVVLYGAKWCPPCRAVKAYLQKNGIAFRYQDIDTKNGRSAYDRARGSYRGIPLTTVGSTKIKGADLKRLQVNLQKSGHLKTIRKFGTNTFGGHRAEWWQTQFRELRQFKKQIDDIVAREKDLAADNVALERLEKFKTIQKEVNGALQQLENDASRHAVPRKFRR